MFDIWFGQLPPRLDKGNLARIADGLDVFWWREPHRISYTVKTAWKVNTIMFYIISELGEICEVHTWPHPVQGFEQKF